MPFNAVPADDFYNRESELLYLKGLPNLKKKALGGDVFLEGGRGLGKTELLKQLYRLLYWEDHVIPFYYSFKTANLRGTYFARDYFNAFVRQYLCFAKKDPAIAQGAAGPLERLMPVISSLGLYWLIDCIEDFQAHVDKNDLYWQIVAAISAPVTAAQKSGKPVTVMLDDFDAAASLYESNLGDAHGLISLFRESIQSSSCPHVMTGSAGALETIFTDQSLLGSTEQMRLGPLPEDVAAELFGAHLANLGITPPAAGQTAFLALLRGNPLYIRNLAKAARKLGKQALQEKDLIDCYSFDVTDGETAFYWSSVLSRYIKTPEQRRAALKILMQALDQGGFSDGKRLSLLSGVGQRETVAIIAALQAAGIVRDRDAVLRDVVQGLHMREVEGQDAGSARRKIEAAHLSKSEEERFELVIPMSSNAELVVAKAVEQIGKNRNLDDEFLNYLQLALIEVCINAMEHSGSYEKKVFLTFITRPDKLEIIAENAGKPFTPDGRKEIPVEEKLRLGMKRGWGFKLIYAIMDDVKVERVNDRTRVIMIKNLTKKEESP